MKLFQNYNDDDDDENEDDKPVIEMPPLSPEEQAKQDKRFHRLLVYVIFQTLVLIALFILVMYKYIETAKTVFQ